MIAARAAEAAAWTQGHKAGIAEQAALLKQHQARLDQARNVRRAGEQLELE